MCFEVGTENAKPLSSKNGNISLKNCGHSFFQDLYFKAML